MATWEEASKRLDAMMRKDASATKETTKALENQYAEHHARALSGGVGSTGAREQRNVIGQELARRGKTEYAPRKLAHGERGGPGLSE